MKTDADKLTPKQEQAITALLAEGTTKAAAAACGSSETTLWRWLQLPEFQSRYRQARRQLVETAIGQLQKHATTAARVLVTIAVDKDAPASSRVAAAKTILDQSVSAIELMDLQERLEKLEELEAARTAETAKGRLRA